MAVDLWVDSHESLLIPLPSVGEGGWWIDAVRVDGLPATAVSRLGERLRIALTAGSHRSGGER